MEKGKSKCYLFSQSVLLSSEFLYGKIRHNLVMDIRKFSC